MPLPLNDTVTTWAGVTLRIGPAPFFVAPKKSADGRAVPPEICRVPAFDVAAPSELVAMTRN